MTQLVSDPARPRGRYGVDGDYRLIPASGVFVGYLSLCFTAAVLAAVWLVTGRTLPGFGAAVFAVVLVGAWRSVVFALGFQMRKLITEALQS
jgi:arsenite methyltransferase